MQMKYPCNTDPNTIAPYKFSNGAWSKISNYTVNSISCSIAFSAPGNTIALALLSGNLTPGIGQYLPYAVAIIVIAVVIVMLLRYFKVMPKRYLRIMLKGKPKQ